jgi:hypothetical protein
VYDALHVEFITQGRQEGMRLTGARVGYLYQVCFFYHSVL